MTSQIKPETNTNAIQIKLHGRHIDMMIFQIHKHMELVNWISMLPKMKFQIALIRCNHLL